MLKTLGVIYYILDHAAFSSPERAANEQDNTKDRRLVPLFPRSCWQRPLFVCALLLQVSPLVSVKGAFGVSSESSGYRKERGLTFGSPVQPQGETENSME